MMTSITQPGATSIHGHPSAFWQFDRAHAPRPLTPLSQEMLLPAFGEGINGGLQQLAYPHRFEMCAVDNFAYLGFVLHAARGEALEQLLADHARRIEPDIPRIGSLWEREWLPSILPGLERLRTFDYGSLSDAELLDALTELRGRSGGAVASPWTHLARVPGRQQIRGVLPRAVQADGSDRALPAAAWVSDPRVGLDSRALAAWPPRDSERDPVERLPELRSGELTCGARRHPGWSAVSAGVDAPILTSSGGAQTPFSSWRTRRGARIRRGRSPRFGASWLCRMRPIPMHNYNAPPTLREQLIRGAHDRLAADPSAAGSFRQAVRGCPLVPADRRGPQLLYRPDGQRGAASAAARAR